MIDARELRIGNYGKLWNFWGKRWSKEMKINGKDISILEKDSSSFEPIPLTEQWFLSCGAETIIARNNNTIAGYKWRVNDFTFILWKREDHYYFLPTKTKIKYVHQLQNLYFALTGEELTIKENA